MLCSFEGPWDDGPASGAPRASERTGLERFPVAMARGKHLFPFRTEQLSPSAPMVLGLHGPGRVGRRRFFSHEPPGWAARRRSGGSEPYAARVEERIILGDNLDVLPALPD